MCLQTNFVMFATNSSFCKLYSPFPKPKSQGLPEGWSLRKKKKRKTAKTLVTVVSQNSLIFYSSSSWNMLFQLIFKCSTVKVSHTFCIEFYPFKFLFHGKQVFLGVGIFGFSEFTFDNLGKLEQSNVKTNAPVQDILYCNFNKAVALIYTFNWTPQIDLCWMKKYGQQKPLFY